MADSYLREEIIDRLKKGGHDSEIAKELKISRNAVIGVRTRAGLQCNKIQHVKRVEEPAPQKPRFGGFNPSITSAPKAPVPPPEKAPVLPPAELVKPETKGILFKDPDFPVKNGCRWTVNETAEGVFFCAEPQARGESWCPYHCTRAFNPQHPSRRDVRPFRR